MDPLPARSEPPDASGLDLTHAFLATIEAAYRGMWAFERALMELDPEVDREDELEKAEHVLETVAEWWQRLESGEPLFELGNRPLLQGEASRAWRLLQVAEARCRSLIGELTGTTDPEVLVEDSWARTIRLAAMVETAHAQYQTVAGLVRRAERFGAPDEAERWRQGLLAAESRIAEAEELVDRFATVEEVDERLARELFDTTLLLPAQVAQRVIDMCRVFGLYTGVFEYTDAGIPDAQVDDWEAYGFDPHAAGRWFAAGLTPSRAAQWIAAGAHDPLIAAGFMWRGFSPEEARAWLDRFIEGRRAAAWMAAGCDPQDACEWIALGIRDPQVVPSFPTATRLM